MKTCGYIVTKGGKSCSLLNVSGLKRGGVLLPGGPVIMFLKPRDARTAISRTKRVAGQIVGSMLEDWVRDRCSELLDSQPYEIQPLVRP